MKESIVPAAGQFDEVIQIIQTSHDRALFKTRIGTSNGQCIL